MDIQNTPPTAARAPVADLPRTKNQLKATALADAAAVKVKWKSLLGEAGKVWSLVPTGDLTRVDGNVHVLAGLVQLRYNISRQESDRQVKDFMEKHYAPGVA